jgi:Flp pilus assembly protein TadG
MSRTDSFTGQSGSVTVLIVAFLPVLILVMGWSIDTARVLTAKVELYKATDLAAREVAREIDLKRAAKTGEQYRTELDVKAREQVLKNLDGLVSGKVMEIDAYESASSIRVTSSAEIPLVFSGLAGKERTTITVTGIGRLMMVREEQGF